MFIELFPNRWLMWAIVYMVAVFIFLWGVIEQYSIELDSVIIENSYLHSIKEL